MRFEIAIARVEVTGDGELAPIAARWRTQGTLADVEKAADYVRGENVLLRERGTLPWHVHAFEAPEPDPLGRARREEHARAVSMRIAYGCARLQQAADAVRTDTARPSIVRFTFEGVEYDSPASVYCPEPCT